MHIAAKLILFAFLLFRARPPPPRLPLRSWHESPMFADEMFGRTIGTPANDFQLQTGRFANITSVFDPDNALAGYGIDPLHTPFGYVGAEYDYKVCF